MAAWPRPHPHYQTTLAPVERTPTPLNTLLLFLVPILLLYTSKTKSRYYSYHTKREIQNIIHIE
ncbi:hypothetical protein C8J57DRAFT_1529775 [Mycena rebaudengoi]|nr:hypothetical protein C8J57DRAFT_1529775 [Mycena rebaudengoi]